MTRRSCCCRWYWLVALCSIAISSFIISSEADEDELDEELEEELDEEVESVLLVLDESLAPSGGGPGGGPPAPLAELLENVLEKTFLSSLAWSLVSLPLDTSPLMRSSILDCMSPDEGAEEELELELLPLLSEESMSSSAEESADASLELIVPDETSLESSVLRRSSGE